MVGGKSKNNHKDQTDKDQTDAAVLKKAMKRFEDSLTYQKDNWHQKWDRDNKLYDNERVQVAYVGMTDTFVPMTFSLIETMTTAIVNANLRFQFKTGNPMKKIDDKPFNALLGEWWDEDQWDLAIEEGSRETFTTGMAGNFVYWDGESNQPRMESYAMRDMVIDPTLRRPAELQKRGAYAGRRYFVRKGQLDDVMIVDTDEESKTYGQLIPRYTKTVDDDKAGDKGEADDKEVKEMFASSTLSAAKDDQDEIIEIWDVDNVVTIKNRKHVIENQVNPYKQRREQLLQRKYLEEAQNAEYDPETAADDMDKAIKEAEKRAKAEAKGIVPFWFMRNYRKLSLFYANSEVNAIAKLQELLNDQTNAENDSIIKPLVPQKELDPDYEDWLDLITDEMGVTYPFKPGSLVDRQTAQVAPTAFNNRMNIKNEIRESTAMDQVTKGVSAEKDATATEIKATLNQSGSRIQSKARIFEKDGFYWFGWILKEMAQLYITAPIVVTTPGSTMTPEEAMAKYGIELPRGAGVFDPADFGDDVRVRVSLEIDEQNRKQEERRDATVAYTQLIQDPTNNIQAAKRILYPKMYPLDQQDLDEIMTAPQHPAMPPLVGGAPAGDPAALPAPAMEMPSGV
jgi:hypothetical protein